jgi:hypothetical protein
VRHPWPVDDSGDTVVGRRRRESPLVGSWSAWRWPLTGLVIASVVLGLGAVRRAAQESDLARDLVAGRVERVDLSPPSEQGVGPTAAIDLGRSFSPQVRWRDTDGRVYQASVRWLTQLPGDTDLGATIGSTAEQAGQPAPQLGALVGGLSATVGRWLPLVVWLLLLGLLLVAPPPRRTTRWAVFWLTLTAGGLGSLWWLWCDAPWSTPPERAERGRRVNGWVMFVVALSVNVAFSALVVIGFTHLWHHGGGSGPVQWSVVDGRGRVTPWDAVR